MPLFRFNQIALKLAAIQEAFKQAGTLAAAAAAATATSAVPTQCDATDDSDDVVADVVDSIDDVNKSAVNRKLSFSPRQLSTGDSQAAALALAGAAVSQAAAALLPSSCQSSVEQLLAKSPTTHDSPGK